MVDESTHPVGFDGPVQPDGRRGAARRRHDERSSQDDQRPAAGVLRAAGSRLRVDEEGPRPALVRQRRVADPRLRR